jgi:heme/copper-type cytochrome/quinol oxidase subunit 3
MKQLHPFHLVTPSPWPVLSAFSALILMTGATLYMHSYQNGLFILLLGLLSLISIMFVWWRDVIREATFEGKHTEEVEIGLKAGMVFFIVSEIMFFAAFFWAFFHSSLAPTIWIGAIWPPAAIITFNTWQIPFLNTAILLLSGAAITYAHNSLIEDDFTLTAEGLVYTLSCAIFFMALQFYEYRNAPFNISDSIYASTFFMATGFHGAHVFIGTIFIFVCFIRFLKNHFTVDHHAGLEAAAWYWHFVDVVWLFLFTVVYFWGSL